jgi:hypothetical protein
VKAQRREVGDSNAVMKVEKAAAATMTASLECYRAVRDAASEASFFQTYGNVFSLYVAGKRQVGQPAGAPAVEARDLPFVQEALASMREGGYAQALARVACLLARKGEPLLLSWLQTKQAMVGEYRDLLPPLAPDEWRRIRGEQEMIVRYEPEQALATLPELLSDPGDRERLVTLVHRLLADERVQRARPSAEQVAMVESIGRALAVSPSGATRSKKGKGARKRAVKAPRKRNGKSRGAVQP